MVQRCPLPWRQTQEFIQPKLGAPDKKSRFPGKPQKGRIWGLKGAYVDQEILPKKKGKTETDMY